MTMLQQQAIKIIDDMPDDKLKTLIDLMKMLLYPTEGYKTEEILSRRIGVAKDQDLYDRDYDIDEYNPEIAKMFGAV